MPLVNKGRVADGALLSNRLVSTESCKLRQRVSYILSDASASDENEDSNIMHLT